MTWQLVVLILGIWWPIVLGAVQVQKILAPTPFDKWVAHRQSQTTRVGPHDG